MLTPVPHRCGGTRETIGGVWRMHDQGATIYRTNHEAKRTVQ